jgi:hypothetical protein
MEAEEDMIYDSGFYNLGFLMYLICKKNCWYRQCHLVKEGNKVMGFLFCFLLSFFFG